MNLKKQHPYLFRILFLLSAGVLAGILWANILIGPGITQNTNTILTSDLNGQYVSYLMYFRNAIMNGKNLSYSFSSLLGNGTAGLIGYYLMSPLNLITLLFPADQIARAVYWIVLLKVAFAGMTSAWFFARKRNYSWKTLIFSTTYALSGYTCAYFMHLMWLDSVVLLPIAAAGIDQLVKENRPALYEVGLALNLIICYYTGYMAAGFCLLYFLFLLIEEKRSGKEILSLMGKYIGGTILAGMLSAFVLVPVFLSQSSASTIGKSTSTQNLSFAKLFSGFFTGNATVSGFQNGGPHLYVGMLILFLVILYLIPHKKEQRRSALCAGSILVLFVASMMIGKLDLVWHLFSVPHGFPYRYVFAVILFLLILAERGLYERVPEIRLQDAVIADALIVLMAAVVYASKKSSLSFGWIGMDAVWLIVISICIYQMKLHGTQWKNAVLMMLVFGQIVMLNLNGFSWMSIHDFDDHSLEGYYQKYASVISDTVKEDADFYRIEKNFSYSENDATLFSYPGLSFFSSADKKTSRDLMEKLGYNVNYMWAGYGTGGSLAGDSFFDLRYFLSDHEMGELKNELHARQDGVYIYENPYVLPLGFGSGDTKNLKFGKSVFENQEKLYSSVLGESVNFYNIQNEYDAVQELNGTEIHTDNVNGHVLKKEKENGSVRYVFTMRNEGPAYLYLYDTDLSGVEISVNGGRKTEYATAESHSILPLGNYHAGDHVTLDFFPEKEKFIFSRMEVASMNLSDFYNTDAKIRLNGWKETEHSENHIEADVEMRKNGTLLTTIPYDKGWNISVDGQKIHGMETMNALLSCYLKKGKHHIILTYETPGRGIGFCISAIGVLILLIQSKIRNGRRKRRDEKKIQI